MKTIIVDDELLAIDGLKGMIEYNCKDIVVVATATNVLEAVKLINIHEPDILLLDINMPEYSGFDLLDLTPNNKYKVIFTTAYEQYALKAIKYAAVDYLLKPINIHELQEAISRVKQTLQLSVNQINIIKQGVLGNFNKINIATIEGVEFIDIDKIIRIEANGNYSTIILENRYILTTKQLKYYEDLIVDDVKFIRVHASHIINVNYILKYLKADGGSLLMSDNTKVIIAQRKKSDVLEVLGL